MTTTTFTNTDAATFIFNGPAAAEAPMTVLPGALSDPATVAPASWTDDLLAIGLMAVVPVGASAQTQSDVDAAARNKRIAEGLSKEDYVEQL